MATSQKGESSGTIGSISKLAGTLVGTVVVTGKRIIGSAATKPKKKAVKRKPAGSSGKGGAPKKKRAQSPAKKKKGAIPKKKKAKSKASSHSQNRLISQVGAETNVPIETQEPQLLIAEAEMADEKFGNTSVSPEVDTGKKGTTGTQKPPVRIIEYSDKPNKATVSTTSDI